jgi:hypothetical protein
MKKLLLLVSLLVAISSSVHAQVGIGTSTPSEKSILDLTSKDKGFLLPRMSTAQRNAIAPNNTTDVGMQVFDETTNSIWMWNGAAWIQAGARNIYDSNGDISPIAITNRVVNFNNGGSLNFDQNTLLIDATNDKVGIGTTGNPTSKLEVNGAATNQTALNAAASNTINFASSNLAFTSSTSNDITLENIKNGGAYTLILTSTTSSGAVTFSATGFTFIDMGTENLSSGKQHMFNFIVAGTNVYVTMATQK